MSAPASSAAVYGPVFLWRFGSSIGVDLLLHDSICSFRCVYCQLGRINVFTNERQLYVPTEEVIEAMLESDWQDADVITFAGSGEPTLAKNLGEALQSVKALTAKQIFVLTNGALLGDAAVADELKTADHVSCKLDAATEEQLLALNRPVGMVSLRTLVRDISAFRERFGGVLSIQTMLLRTNVNRAREFVPLLEMIRPNEVYLTLPSRLSPGKWNQELRGDHESFSAARAFRHLHADEVMAFKTEIEASTGIRVNVPPTSDATGHGRSRR